ncbi:MAG: radical SAM protein [Clostridia bacterium]|nr:radical SAM protein [Clostridia bacterium]
MKEFDIHSYMVKGISHIVRDALFAAGKNAKELKYMTSFAKATERAAAKRTELEAQGEHIPPFLIASITSSCNLHCAGCYSRANNACTDCAPKNQLSAEEWDKIFTEAEELGISFILLAGGEPMIRRDVIEKAASHDGILFPIFTNGTFLGEKYTELLDAHRNLLPVISIEGDEKSTDERRGSGVYRKVTSAMESLNAKGMAFGASITVTTENVREVYSDEYVDGLHKMGCKAIIYVEFVPVTDESAELAPGDEERAFMQKELARLRGRNIGMVFVAFPGDEKGTGGCIAAGRGFFHINSHGGAEPCPFSPYSDINVKDTSVREALKSPLFYAINTEGLLLDDHVGGCTLYTNRERVEEIINKERKQ